MEWRPRDLVGGDIYFIKDFPDRVYIAVVDCTGHGVPGAFLSIIARSHLDKAIDVENHQSAGSYLSSVNELKETLSRSDQKNTSEEGFDGGVCIYYRKEHRLELRAQNPQSSMSTASKQPRRVAIENRLAPPEWRQTLPLPLMRLSRLKARL